MKFIFPQNFNFKPKLLGVIDYQTAIINIILWLLLFFILNLLFIDLIIKIIIFIIVCFPFVLLSIVGFNHENIIYVISYLIKYIKCNKIYLYKK